MWFASSAEADTSASVSPAASERLLAKSTTRVRLSEFTGSDDVGANGSVTRVTESTAIARVEFVWVSSVGPVASCARAGRSSAARQKTAKMIASK